MSKTRALLTETEREQIAGEHGKQRRYQATSRIRDRIKALQEDMKVLQKNDQKLYDDVVSAMEGPLAEQHELMNWLETEGGVKNPDYEEYEWSVTPIIGNIEYGEPVNTGGPIDTIPNDDLSPGVYEIYTTSPTHGDHRWMQYVLVKDTNPLNWETLNTPKDLITQFINSSDHPSTSAFTEGQLLELIGGYDSKKGSGTVSIRD